MDGSAGEPVRLHLGCGFRHLPGFVNVDLAGPWCKKEPEVCADITKPLPFDSGSADLIYACHVLEHFNRWEMDGILADWVRVLKPGGLLVIELPCFDKILALIDLFYERGEPLNMQLTMWGLYGDPGHQSEAMMHRWCYSSGEMQRLLERAGLEAREEEPLTHIAARDMRFVSRKL